MKIKHITFLFFITSVLSLSAQTNDSTYQQYLMNNKNVPKRVYYSSDVKDIIKTDIPSIIDGIIPVIWEHRFNDNFGIEGGVGLIMKYSVIDYFNEYDRRTFSDVGLFGLNPAFKNKKYGTGLHIEPRFFTSGDPLFLGSNGTSFISCTYNRNFYSNLDISEIGAGYGTTFESDIMSLQLAISIFRVNQTAHNSADDFKYQGQFCLVEGLKAKSLRISIGIQLGLNMPQKMKPLKSK